MVNQYNVTFSGVFKKGVREGLGQ